MNKFAPELNKYSFYSETENRTLISNKGSYPK